MNDEIGFLNKGLRERVKRFHKAGARRSEFTEREFFEQMVDIGLNVYEKQILPWEAGGALLENYILNRRQGNERRY